MFNVLKQCAVLWACLCITAYCTKSSLHDNKTNMNNDNLKTTPNLLCEQIHPFSPFQRSNCRRFFQRMLKEKTPGQTDVYSGGYLCHTVHDDHSNSDINRGVSVECALADHVNQSYPLAILSDDQSKLSGDRTIDKMLGLNRFTLSDTHVSLIGAENLKDPRAPTALRAKQFRCDNSSSCYQVNDC